MKYYKNDLYLWLFFAKLPYYYVYMTVVKAWKILFHKIKFFLIILCLFFCISCVSGQEFYMPIFKSNTILENPYGICTHINREGDRWEFDTKEIELKLIKQTGASFLRTEFDWASDHRKKKDKKFELAFPLFDKSIKSIDGSGIQTLGILSMCRENEQFDLWKDYVSQLSCRYQQVKYWEVVNEVDIVRKYLVNRVPPFTVDEYVPILKAGYTEIKKSNKNAVVLFSGLSSIYNGAIDTILCKNIGCYFDIMNMHWYTTPTGKPEELLNFLQSLSSKMEKYKIDKPLWMTEVGYSTAYGYVDEYHQDIQLPRTFLICFACGVEKVFWYNGRAFENIIDDKEDHFGLWHRNYTPKPAFYAYKTLIDMCPDKSTRPQLVRYNDVYMASWIRPDYKRVWALWSSKNNIPVKLIIKGRCAFFDNHGQKLKTNSNICVVSPSIIYLVGARDVRISEEHN